MNRVAICCLAAAALALGCVADGPEPVSHRAGPGVWIETKPTYCESDNISYQLEINFDGDSDYFYPCVDNLVVWETLKRSGRVWRSRPFESDVAGSEGGVPGVPCKAVPSKIWNLKSVTFEIPLNYYAEGEPSPRVYEMPSGEYQLSLVYAAGLALSVEGLDERFVGPLASVRSQLFGGEREWNSNIVNFTVTSAAPCPPQK